MRRSAVCICSALWLLAVPGWPQVAPTFRVESAAPNAHGLREVFTADQIALLEKINRADAAALDTLSPIVLPDSWTESELSYSPMPRTYEAAARYGKLLVVYLPGQTFGAYESGVLVRWGPVSSGSAERQTPAGFYTLNWRSVGRASTENPEWYMRWYFNFGNREGLAFHQHLLPGYPASHGCVRLLERDARWLFDWGAGWVLAADGSVAASGTPVVVAGAYDFTAPPPWRSPEWLAHPVALPVLDRGGLSPQDHQ